MVIAEHLAKAWVLFWSRDPVQSAQVIRPKPTLPAMYYLASQAPRSSSPSRVKPAAAAEKQKTDTINHQQLSTNPSQNYHTSWEPPSADQLPPAFSPFKASVSIKQFQAILKQINKQTK